MESVIARNPDGESRQPYLLRVPLGDGLVFKAGGTLTGGTRPGPAATGDLAGVARGPSGNAMVVPAPG